jgi:nucleoside phosphorylase
MAASGGALDAVELPTIDVLIVVALEAELDAVLAEGGGADGWQKVRDHVHVRTLPNGAGQALGVAAAWTGAMGAMATATRAAPLVKELQPSCLAMCGICAGKRGDVALGDVIVADRVYSFDHGKLVAAENGKGPQSFFHDIATYNLERSWHMDAAAFRRDLGWAKELLPSRPPTKQAQRRWLLRTLHAYERGGGLAPLAHPERAAMFRTARPGAKDWAQLIVDLRKQALLEPGPAVLKLTEAGRLAAEDDHLLYPDGAPGDPEFQVHVGPIATGNAVIEDPQIFKRLKLVERKTLGVEMEAFAIGYVGDTLPQRAIVAKAVSDHADHDKDDRFREFACRASAAWMFAFLKQHLTPKNVDQRAPGSAPPGDPGPRSPFPDLAASRLEESRRDADEQKPLRELRSGNDRHGLDELHRRVERALALRHPGARATWKQGPDEVPAPLRSFLEIREPRGRHTTLHVVAVIDGDVDGPTFEAFFEHIVKRYGTDLPYIEPSLVYTGAASAAVLDEAGRWRVDLEPLLELQGLLEFRPYLEQQMSRLEGDPIYPPGLFVPQRLAYRVGFDPFRSRRRAGSARLLARPGRSAAHARARRLRHRQDIPHARARAPARPAAPRDGPRHRPDPGRATEAGEVPQPRRTAGPALHPRARHAAVRSRRVQVHARGGARRAAVRRLRRAGAARDVRGGGRAPEHGTRSRDRQGQGGDHEPHAALPE